MTFSCPSYESLPPVRQPSRVVKGFLPNSTPIIYSLSTTSSKENEYTTIIINGQNFLPFNTSTVIFGNVKNIFVNYFSSFQISFTLPINNYFAIPSGTYTIQVVNVDNKTQVYPLALYSNKINYTLEPS